MKKIALFLSLILVNISFVDATSVEIVLANNSTSSVWIKDFKLNLGMMSHYRSAGEIGTQYKPGETLDFKSGGSDWFCGADGYLELEARFENKTYSIFFGFNNPYWGDNDFFAQTKYPYIIKYISGGDGTDMVLHYELTGGPTPTPPPPPPPPIALPKTGSKIISGQFSWNMKETGEPKSGDIRTRKLNYLTNAFDVQITAPTELVLNREGTGTAQYQGVAGFYSSYEKLAAAKIEFTESKGEIPNSMNTASNPLSPIKTIKFTISNLPDGVPLFIAVHPKDPNWNPGVDSPEKPATNKESRWMVLINEKSKTEALVKYEVLGAWFIVGGSYSPEHIPVYIKNILDIQRKAIKQPDFNASPVIIKRQISIKPRLN